MIEGYRVNAKNLHYAMNTTVNGAVTRGTPSIMSEIMKITVNPTVATGKLHGDGAQVSNASKLTGATIALNVTKIPSDVLNAILGRTKDANGIVKDNKADVMKEFSLGWEVELDNGGSEFIWFTKCKAQPIQSEVQQSEDNITYSTDTLNITAMPDENGDVKLFGETIDTGFKCATTWFLTVPPVEPVTP